MRRILSLLLIAGLGASARLTAQDLGPVCDALARVTVGQWAAYRISGVQAQGGAGPTEARMAIVGTEEREGASMYWHESRMETPRGQMVMQVLVPRFPFGAGEIVAAVMKVGTSPAMELSADMLRMMQEQGASGAGLRDIEDCRQASVVGRESVTVPAGAFEALHVTVTDPVPADLWVSADVPFGVIKSEGQDGSQMVLTGFGSDAASSIADRPGR